MEWKRGPTSASTRKGEDRMNAKQYVALSMAAVFFGSILTTCATSERTYQGAAAGGAIGAITGILLDKNNRWRGGAIGATIGAALGGTVTEVATRASREAAEQGHPATYESGGGSQQVVSTPRDAPATHCQRVCEQVYRDGGLVRDQLVDICTG